MLHSGVVSPSVPHNLTQYVVEQDYEQYTEIDQAVWRFVLLQTYERLQRTAHAAYRDGLGLTGISVARIPRIAQMNECLARFGWGAVCVDGFIPPRAFQEFQAAGILPIAADMRALDHLVYTPAPDIIHEAAGHAPILTDARYAAYLRAIGEVGKKAFSSPDDARVDAAIFELSEAKELRSADPTLLARAEARLEQALAAVGATSEASRLSRLYWWTAEYGLLGNPRDYRLYGAGLLSSLWESHSCHEASVRKLPLSAACTDQAYDITRPQPQLFVAQDFEHLFGVLSEVDASLVHRAGGDRALRAALTSESIATLHFGAERFATGQLSAVLGSAQGGLLTLRGRVGLGLSGKQHALFDAPPPGYHLPFGPWKSDTSTPMTKFGQRVRLSFAAGAQLEGELANTTFDPAGLPLFARLRDYHLVSAAAGLSERGAEYVLMFAPEFSTAHAGAIDAAFFPASAPSLKWVPAKLNLQQRERALLSLYERAITAFREHLGSAAVPVFSTIHAELNRSFADEWLLRWNLLECLCKLGQTRAEHGAFARTLQAELEALELKFSHREPIASGLRYLAQLAA